MFRTFSTIVAAFAVAAPALAHFVFIVPQPAGKEVQIVFSDSLEPDEGVPIDKVADMKLFARDDSGKDIAVKTTTGKHSLSAVVPPGTRDLFGELNYDVMTKKGSTFLLRYHAKAMVKGGLNSTPIGDKAGFEVVPIGKPGAVRFQAVMRGKPAANAEFTILTPDGHSTKATGDAEGRSSELKETGRYGVWAKTIEKAAGKHDSKDYTEIRHYASIVVDVPAK